ncbi:hypothetical protein OUZ56_004647 [Daphnia magna]|uniref:Uncharacterized protein n=1 Tax=Daphnia magna TaxID=35525 RepID=A0ABQ9YQE7_9CRUS|nr:hypothetical protein OUZ56_004647 [Daphnia magna]
MEWGAFPRQREYVKKDLNRQKTARNDAVGFPPRLTSVMWPFSNTANVYLHLCVSHQRVFMPDVCIHPSSVEHHEGQQIETDRRHQDSLRQHGSISVIRLVRMLPRFKVVGVSSPK